jgi:hypothetical protein
MPLRYQRLIRYQMLHACAGIRDPHRRGSPLSRHRGVRSASRASVSACHHRATRTTIPQGPVSPPAGSL